MPILIFYLFAFLLLSSALYVVITRNIARAIFAFFGTLFCLSVLYVFAMADFIAVTQILVYVGGVVVLLMFGLMLSNRTQLDSLLAHKIDRFGRLKGIPSLLLCIALFIILIHTMIISNLANIPWIIKSKEAETIITGVDNTVKSIGLSTMSAYIIPFEIVSIFLLAALIGAAYLARRKKGYE